MKLKNDLRGQHESHTWTYLGRQLRQDEQGLALGMSGAYARKLCELVGIDEGSKGSDTIPELVRSPGDEPLAPAEHQLLRQGVGLAMWIAGERPDIVYATPQFNLGSPTEVEMIGLKRLEGPSISRRGCCGQKSWVAGE